MGLTNKAGKTDWASVFITALTVVLLITLISKLFKDLSSKRGMSIVSEEGSEILSNDAKSKAVLKEIEEFHKTGKWEEISS